MFIEHDWRFLGESKGYPVDVTPKDVPDTAENRVTEIHGAGQFKFRRGSQYARVNLVHTKLWKYDGQRSSDAVKLLNTAIADLQRVLAERSPKRV